MQTKKNNHGQTAEILTHPKYKHWEQRKFLSFPLQQCETALLAAAMPVFIHLDDFFFILEPLSLQRKKQSSAASFALSKNRCKGRRLSECLRGS